jgi:2-polyprenyl-3-methyl-5-hydroxy-6-metoxy-1,4-benzoquinol methylase
LRRPGGKQELSDTAFVERVYRELLLRPPDPTGLAWNLQRLDAGADRLDVVLDLVNSEEYQHQVVRRHVTLPDLKVLRPDRYRLEPKAGKAPDADDGVPVFVAQDPSDLDWLEDRILEFGYYERPGIWTLGVDEDKRLMADLLASLDPTRALELGCASGAVIQCLDDAGIYAEGVEISRSAIRRARPDVAERIHCGDLLGLDLERYDLVYGLDIFEHFNPNRLGEYLTAIADLVADGGLLFANIPAFGTDPVFGEIFDLFLDEWREADRAGRPFSLLQVDDEGYPMHGHLIWATSAWWQEQFEQVGLRREIETERMLHRRFDADLERISIARKSFLVFSKARA